MKLAPVKKLRGYIKKSGFRYKLYQRSQDCLIYEKLNIRGEFLEWEVFRVRIVRYPNTAQGFREIYPEYEHVYRYALFEDAQKRFNYLLKRGLYGYEF